MTVKYETKEEILGSIKRSRISKLKTSYEMEINTPTEFTYGTDNTILLKGEKTINNIKVSIEKAIASSSDVKIIGENDVVHVMSISDGEELLGTVMDYGVGKHEYLLDQIDLVNNATTLNQVCNVTW